jgi:hypothetical protein
MNNKYWWIVETVMKIFWNAGEIWYVDGHIDPEPEF